MTKNYYVKERMVAARPRSKRLRKLGGATSTGTSSVSYSTWEGGGESTPFTLSITGGSNVVTINGTTLNLAHGHDWGDVVNKPNLIEGVSIGKNKVSFLHSNGDTTTADFSAIMTALNGKASVTSVQNLVNSRGMVIDPYVWATTYNPDNEDWTDCEGEYWYDSSASKLKICAGFILGVPQFVELRGMFLVWHDTAGQLSLYTYYGSGTPTLTTIFTA